MAMSRAAGLAQLDAVMREIDRALDRRHTDRNRAWRDFHLACIKRRTLLRWLAK